MADTVEVTIVTPEREVYSGPATEVQVPGWEGEFDVLPGHDLFLSLLRGGIVDLKSPAGNHRWIVGRGFAEATAEKVTILTDRAEPAAGVDKAGAQQALSEADAALAEAAAGTPEWERAEERREIAAARLSA